MALPYWTLAELEAAVGPDLVARYIDDDHDGAADGAAITRLQKTCDSKVESWFRGTYSLDALRSVKPETAVRLSLEAARIELFKRHPEIARADWRPYEDSWRKECGDIRSGKMRLDIETSPEPAANNGGVVWDGGDDESELPKPVFSDPGSMGIF